MNIFDCIFSLSKYGDKKNPTQVAWGKESNRTVKPIVLFLLFVLQREHTTSRDFQARSVKLQ